MPLAPTMFDPLALVTKLDEPGDRGEPVYEIATDVLYPTMLAAIADTAAKPTPGDDAAHYERHLNWCRAHPRAMSDAALDCQTREAEQQEQIVRDGKVVETKTVKVLVPIPVCDSIPDSAEDALAGKKPGTRRAERAQVLETCRLWFTNELHQAIGGGPVKLRITNTPASKARWRL